MWFIKNSLPYIVYMTEYDLLIYYERAVTWLEYCRYGAKHKTTLQTICGGVLLFTNVECDDQLRSR